MEGKSREFQVSSEDLYSEEQILNQLFTEVFDNDLITPSQRADIEKRLDDVFRELTAPKTTIEKASDAIEFPARDQKDRLAWLMGVATSIIGAATAFTVTASKDVPVLTDGRLLSIKLLIPFIGVFFASLATVGAIFILKRSREAPEESSKKVAMQEGVELEQEIISILDKVGVPYEIQPSSAGLLRPDFLINLNNKRIALEVRNWRSTPALGILSMVRDHAKYLIDHNTADEVLVVTNLKSPISQNLSHIKEVRFLALKDLAGLLRKEAA